MQQAFPGTALPANVVVKAPSVRIPAARSAIAELERRALASGRAFEPITVDVNRQGTVANITVPIAGNGTDAASNAAFRMLRETIVPETVGALPSAEAGVTGRTAAWKDAAAELKSNLAPRGRASCSCSRSSLMLVAFRSIVVAVKAILLNLLSVAAAYGVLVLVFQHGVGKGLLGVSSADGIETVVPLLLFVILFGLSMDYHVFILSRIRENYDRGETMDDAVAHGIKSTAGVVTSAAIVMVVRVRGLRHAVDAVLQAVRRRAGGRDPDRRDHRSRRAAAGHDEAARDVELVPAQLARVAAAARARRRARGASGGAGLQRPKRRASTSSSGRVLSTSDGPAPPRRAVATDEARMFSSPRVEWASVEHDDRDAGLARQAHVLVAQVEPVAAARSPRPRGPARRAARRRPRGRPRSAAGG